MSAETAKWYVLHTRSGYEALVKSGLEKLIENNNMTEVITEIQIPMEQTIEERNGKKKVVERKRFPCYVFIKMVYSNDYWYMITNTRGVTGFVGPQGRPMPLTTEEVQRLGIDRQVALEAKYEVGDAVKIASGAMANFIGEIESVNEAAQKAMVKVAVFGRDTSIELSFADLIKVAADN